MVENVIYYFSGTGNSLDLAKHIAEQLGNSMLVSMGTSPYENSIRTAKRVGFVYPVYYGGIPDLVHKYMEIVRMPANSYVFCVASGKGYCGNALKEAEYIFSKREEHLSFGAFVPTVDNNIIEYGKIKNTERALASSYATLKEIVFQIALGDTNHQGLMNPIVSFLHQHKLSRARRWENDYEVNRDCSHCGICSMICPVDNIDLVDGRPLFLHRCQACMACIQACPEKAINYGSITNGKERYFHPNIPPEELASMQKPIAFPEKIHYHYN